MARVSHFKLNLKVLRILSAFIGVFWAAAIVLIAVGSLPTYRKVPALAVYVLSALVTAGNLAYRYRQLSKREK